MTSLKRGLSIFLMGVLSITILDSLGSVASRELGFKYSHLIPISFIIYVLTAFLIAKKTDRKTGVFFAGLLGLFDATIGWKICVLLKANTGNTHTAISITTWIIMAVLVTIIGALQGLLGAWIATKFFKLKSPSN